MSSALFSVSLADVIREDPKGGHAAPAPEPLPDFFDFNKQVSEYLSPFIDDADFIFPEEQAVGVEEFSIPMVQTVSGFTEDQAPSLPKQKKMKTLDSRCASSQGCDAEKNESANPLLRAAADIISDVQEERRSSWSGGMDDMLDALASRVSPPSVGSVQCKHSFERPDADVFTIENDDLTSTSLSSVWGEIAKTLGLDMGAESTPNEENPPLSADNAGSGSTNKKKRRQAVLTDEQAELTRRRNREHARSTRRRKKLYVEKLKQQVSELLAKQQHLEQLADGSSSGLNSALPGSVAEQTALRKGVVQRFLQSRTKNVQDPRGWGDLVDHSFTLLQPRTPYHGASIGEFVGNNRRIHGIDELRRDTDSLNDLVKSIQSQVQTKMGGQMKCQVNLRYQVDSADMLVVGDKLMCHWKLATNGLLAYGYPSECSIDGMMKCTFNEKHKLLDMELTYDVMAFSRQLQEYSLVELLVHREELGPKHPDFLGATNNRPEPQKLPSFSEAFGSIGTKSSAASCEPLTSRHSSSSPTRSLSAIKSETAPQQQRKPKQNNENQVLPWQSCGKLPQTQIKGKAGGRKTATLLPSPRPPVMPAWPMMPNGMPNPFLPTAAAMFAPPVAHPAFFQPFMSGQMGRVKGTKN